MLSSRCDHGGVGGPYIVGIYYTYVKLDVKRSIDRRPGAMSYGHHGLAGEYMRVHEQNMRGFLLRNKGVLSQILKFALRAPEQHVQEASRKMLLPWVR